MMRHGVGRCAAVILGMCAVYGRADAQVVGPPGYNAAFGGAVEGVNRYVWRGLELNGRPNVQPSAWVAWGPLEVGTWGSHSVEGDYHEQDFWVTYAFPRSRNGSLALTLNDYYAVTSDFGTDFFDYSGVVACDPEDAVGDPPRCAGGAHTLEVVGQYQLASIPLELLGAYNFHNDPENAVYAEAAVRPSVAGFQFGFVAGGVIGASEWYYGIEETALTNLAAGIARSVEFGGLSIPIGTDLVYNPHLEESFWVLRGGINVSN